MFTAKIIDIKKDVYQSTQEPFLDVEVSILDENGDIVDTRKYAYKIDTTKEAITADLEKMLETYIIELAQEADQKALLEISKKADETIEALKDAEIGVSE